MRTRTSTGHLATSVGRSLSALLVSVALACGGEPPGEAPAAPASAPPVRAMPHAVRLALGATFSCVIDRERQVWCWGELPGEVEGVAPEDRIRRPHEIARLRGAIEIAASATTLCARTADHRVLCWGEDASMARSEEHAPGEVRGLEGTRSLAVGSHGVCAVHGETLRCIAQNRAPDLGSVPAGATLRSIGATVCAVDGVGPALCLGADDAELRAVAGSEGAVAIAVADGVCAVTSSGELRCDADARVIADAHLAPVAGEPAARWVAGGAGVRCVARGGSDAAAAGASCARSGEGRGPPRSALDAELLALAVGGDATSGWHACALLRRGPARDDEVRCWGANRAGEVGRSPIEHGRAVRLADAPPAREVAVVDAHLVLLDADGHARVRPLGAAETGEPLAALGVLSGIAGVNEAHACANAADGALVCLDPASGSHRRLEGFGGRGRVFGAAGYACAATDGESVTCALPMNEGDEPRVVARGLRDAAELDGRVCGLRGGDVACVSLEGRRGPGTWPEGFARPAEPVLPTRVSTLFAGAEQLFAVRADGAALAFGHNGVGQLGRPPSRPIARPVPVVLPPGTTAMAFARHVSCAYGERAGVTCAGLDEALAPREGPSRFLFGQQPPDESVRGDGRWTQVAGLRGARSVSIGPRGLACAAADDGAVWCWGRWPADMELERVTEPTVVRLGEGA